MLKNMKLKTRIVICFTIMNVLMITSLIVGYLAVKKTVGLDDADKQATIAKNFNIFVGVLLVVFIVVMLVITIDILKTLELSIGQLTKAAKDLSSGKVDTNLEKRANDEFAVVVDEFQLMVNNVKEQAQVVEEVANGNLTVEITPKSEDDLMGMSLNKLVTGTHSALSNIHEAAYQVMTSSSEVASASEALAQGSTEQASAIEEITASIDDIAEKTKTNAKQAESAAELMTEAIEDVNKGNARMNDMVSAMQDINVSSENISKIIKVIDDIAFQTNILALNAAVEAARAGDAGMGFAVVAEEVRSLAAKSAAAAAETAEMIEDSIKKVHLGTGIAGETAKALDDISMVVKQSEEIVRGIAQSSNYQATAIDQIDKAIEQVSQVVSSNSSTSEECAAASLELSSQAERMQDLVSVYNLGNNVASTSKSGKSYGYVSSASDHNESIISLKDGFGKY